MLTVNPGPFSLSVEVLLLLVAVLVAAAVGGVAGRARKAGIGHALSDMLIAALLAARITFVALWFDAYRGAPWSMLDIRDGGFDPSAGLAAAILVALWQGWHHAARRQPLALDTSACAASLTASRLNSAVNCLLSI